MFSVELATGNRFEAKSDESLLAAAQRAGIQLSYSCKTGRCSSCKCKLISGETGLLSDETGLTVDEKSNGWILSCVRYALNNIVIDAEDISKTLLAEPKTLPCRISGIDFLATDVVRVFLRFPPNAIFQFLPGQYVDVIGPGGVRRSYSLANADFKKNLLEIHIRKVDNGVMSHYWFQEAKNNDLLRIFGPLGTFFVREIKDIDLIFLATGTGIAPVKSILESMKDISFNEKPRSIQVLWGGRSIQDFYLNFYKIAEKFKYTPVLSREDPEWIGAKGYVQDELLKIRENFENTVVYACGSSSMIKSAKIKLTKAGLPELNFYSDAFVSSDNIN